MEKWSIIQMAEFIVFPLIFAASFITTIFIVLFSSFSGFLAHISIADPNWNFILMMMTESEGLLVGKTFNLKLYISCCPDI